MSQKYKDGIVVQEYDKGVSAYQENLDYQVAKKSTEQIIEKKSSNGFSNVKFQVPAYTGGGGGVEPKTVFLDTDNITYNGVTYEPTGYMISAQGMLIKIIYGSTPPINNVNWANPASAGVNFFYLCLASADQSGSYHKPTWCLIDIGLQWNTDVGDNSALMKELQKKFPILNSSYVATFPAVINNYLVAEPLVEVVIDPAEPEETVPGLKGHYEVSYYEVDMTQIGPKVPTP